MQTGIARLPVLLILAMAGLGLLRYSDETPDADPGLSQGSIQTPVPSGQRPDAILVGPGQAEGVDLRADFERILRETRNQEGIWAVLAVSLDLGDTLLAENPRLPVVPASNQKLLTTGAAFHILGPDFRYQTFLLSDGTLADGRLDGNLILYGTGDPTLSDRFFPSETAPLDSLVRRVTEAGIQEVRGDLVIDGSYFSGPELHPDWKASDLNDAFAAPVAAIAFNENLITVRVEAGSAPQVQPTIHTLPPGSGIPVLNTAITAPRGTRPRVWLNRETPRDPIGIEGEIPVGGRDVWRELPVPDPLLYVGRHLRRALESGGVTVSGRTRVVRDPTLSVLSDRETLPIRVSGGARILGVHSSPPLLEILRVVNKESNNLLAETVAKTLGRVTFGEGSFQGGMRAVERFLLRDVGVPESEIRLRDGSGLSAQNQVSAGALLKLLRFMAASNHWEGFWSTLPEAGVRGELGRMRNSPAARNLRAKTGTMEGVSSLSGMVRTRSGERILFSILANDHPSEYRAKRAEDRIGILLASLTREPAPSGAR